MILISDQKLISNNLIFLRDIQRTIFQMIHTELYLRKVVISLIGVFFANPANVLVTGNLGDSVTFYLVKWTTSFHLNDQASTV